MPLAVSHLFQIFRIDKDPPGILVDALKDRDIGNVAINLNRVRVEVVSFFEMTVLADLVVVAVTVAVTSRDIRIAAFHSAHALLSFSASMACPAF